MDKVVYERLLQQAEKDYRENVAAIERVWKISQSMRQDGETAPLVPLPTDGNTTSSPSTPSRERIERGDLIAAIRDAVCTLDANKLGHGSSKATFTFSDIIRVCEQRAPGLAIKRGSLGSLLRRMAEGGELKIVEQ